MTGKRIKNDLYITLQWSNIGDQVQKKTIFQNVYYIMGTCEKMHTRENKTTVSYKNKLSNFGMTFNVANSNRSIIIN